MYIFKQLMLVAVAYQCFPIAYQSFPCSKISTGGHRILRNIPYTDVEIMWFKFHSVGMPGLILTMNN